MVLTALAAISSKGQHVLGIKVPSLSPRDTSTAHAASLPAEQHCCPWRVALRGDSMDAPGLAQVKVATELERGDDGGNLEHWTFRDIQPVQATGDQPAEVTHLSPSTLP